MTATEKLFSLQSRPESCNIHPFSKCLNWDENKYKPETPRHEFEMKRFYVRKTVERKHNITKV